MLPKAIHVESYRGFRDRTSLQLRKLTLLYGTNGAGKSSLLRLFPLLAASAGKPGPLDMEADALRGATFPDLVWRGTEAGSDDLLSTPSSGFRLELEWDSPKPARLAVRFSYQQSWNRVIAFEFELELDGTLELWTCDLREAERSSPVLTYLGSGREVVTEERRVRLDGIRPHDADDRAWPLAEKLGKYLGVLTTGSQWLGRRASAERGTVSPGPAPTRLSPDGREAPLLLDGNEQLLKAVSREYEAERLFSRKLEIVREGTQVQLQAVHPRIASIVVPLAQAGEGAAQLLPLVTCAEYLRSGEPDAPLLLAFEEPESHLHPATLRGFGEYLTEVVASLGEQRLVVETHSQILLLCVQLAIARKTIAPEDVALYWVHQSPADGAATCVEVPFGPHGELDAAWPRRVFEPLLALSEEWASMAFGDTKP